MADGSAPTREEPADPAARKEFPTALPLMRREMDQSEIRVIKNDDGFVRLTFPVSSETPVSRWYGEEILSHESGSVRMDRMKRGACTYLFNHDWDDPVGVVEGARIENKRLVVDVKMFKTARAEEVAAMIDGGLRNVSLMYRIHVVEEDVKKQRYTITDWEPMEVSTVTIPADPTVGVGRSAEGGEKFEVRMVRALPEVSPPALTAKPKEPSMAEENAAAGASAERTNGAGAAPRIEAGQQQEQPNAVEMERGRKRAIETLCKANNLEDRYKDHWIRSGLSLEAVADDLLAILKERGETNPQPASRLGLTASEQKRFSFQRAIIANADNDWSKAGFELECSRAVAAKVNKAPDPKRFFVPFDVLEREVPVQRRDLTTGVPSAAGYLVQTTNMGFIEMLRNRSVAFRMGALRLSGLQGNVTIPRQSAAATAYWLGTEATQITESQQTFVQLAMTPKTCGAYTEVSRNLMMQSSPAAEGIVTDDLARTTAVAADLAVIRGSGLAGQPLGIIGTTGIGAVTGTSFTQAGILEFQSDVASSNVVPVRGGYVTTPAVAVLAASRVKFSGSQEEIWKGNVWDGEMAGFPAMSSNQMASGTMLFGDWNEVVVAEWGVLEVEVNPYANFQAGILGIRCMYSLDVGVRRPFAFSYGAAMT
jgi:HK97 family phage major capsid protein/HK97 family phage prohead protease